MALLTTPFHTEIVLQPYFLEFRFIKLLKFNLRSFNHPTSWGTQHTLSVPLFYHL